MKRVEQPRPERSVPELREVQQLPVGEHAGVAVIEFDELLVQLEQLLLLELAVHHDLLNVTLSQLARTLLTHFDDLVDHLVFRAC